MNLEFRVTKKFVNELLDVLDELVKEIRREEKEKYPYAEWERKRELVKKRLKKTTRVYSMFEPPPVAEMMG